MNDTRFREALRPLDSAPVSVVFDPDMAKSSLFSTFFVLIRARLPDWLAPTPCRGYCLGCWGERLPNGKGIMLNDSMIDTFAALAGPDFAWTGVKGCGRPPSSYMGRKGIRQALRLDLIARQGGVCFACGDMLDESAEFCHIVSRGPGIRGWLPGNVAVGHAECNERQKQRGPIVRIADMARPDVVPLDWTPFKHLGM